MSIGLWIHLGLEVLVDGEGGHGRGLAAHVPQLEAHEVARQHVAPVPAELQVAHGRQQLGEEAALRARRLRLHTTCATSRNSISNMTVLLNVLLEDPDVTGVKAILRQGMDGSSFLRELRCALGCPSYT